jgi:phosphomevalonate kinase
MNGPVTVQAPGKLLLCGEYAVVHGAPALCAAINRHASCTVKAGQGLRLTALGDGPLTARVEDNGVTWDPAPRQPARWKLVEAVLRQVRPAAGLDITLESGALSEVFTDGGAAVKLGLGSSAAAAVSLVAALDVAAHGAKFSPDARRRWFETAQRAHLAAQGGLGSGVDVAASAMGGVFVYQRSGDDPAQARVEQVRYEKLGVRMVAVWTGAAASTVDLLGTVEAWRAREPARAEKRFAEMTALAERAARAASDGDRRSLLMTLDAYGAQMQQLGEESGADIVNNAHRKVRELARQHECVAKPSGAGGGDVAVCFAPSGWEADDLRQTLTQAGYPVLNLAFDHDGATAPTA